MPMSDQLASALNTQITAELGASLSYLQMSAHFEANDRPGMAQWMHRQSEEEADHAQQFIDFLIDRGGRVAIGDIAAPPSEFSGPLSVFEASLAQEKEVTGMIRDLYQLATEENDLESLPFLHGFLTEQVEEESTVNGIVERIRRVHDSEVALLLLEQELGSRTSSE